MIRRTVAFEADNVAAGLVWMNDTYIDSVLGDADLQKLGLSAGDLDAIGRGNAVRLIPRLK